MSSILTNKPLFPNTLPYTDKQYNEIMPWPCEIIKAAIKIATAPREKIIEEHVSIERWNTEESTASQKEFATFFAEHGIPDPSDPKLLTYIEEQRRKNYPGSTP